MSIANSKQYQRQFHLGVKEESNLSPRQHPPNVGLGAIHKANFWVLPAGIHLKTAKHNFGIKVELDLKAKQRKCPKPIIILTSKEFI